MIWTSAGSPARELVRELRAGLVLVSHDQEFLARSVTRILSLNWTIWEPRPSSAADTTATSKSAGSPVGTVVKRYREFAERLATWCAPSSGVVPPTGCQQRDPQGADNDKIRRRAATVQ